MIKFKGLNIYSFLNSVAKVLRQTAKTCQYVKENYKKVHFFNFGIGS
jgi:hypothetical protein